VRQFIEVSGVGDRVQVDQAALAGVAVAGIISISSAEGRYEPFDAVVGIVLGLLLVAFYRPKRPTSPPSSVFQSMAGAAVFGLVLCIVAAPMLDAYVAPLTHESSQAGSTRVSWMLLNLWFCLFVVGFDVLFFTFLRPAPSSG